MSGIWQPDSGTRGNGKESLTDRYDWLGCGAEQHRICLFFFLISTVSWGEAGRGYRSETGFW